MKPTIRQLRKKRARLVVTYRSSRARVTDGLELQQTSLLSKHTK